MKASELRIGNIVNQTGSVQGVVTELRINHARIRYTLAGQLRHSLVSYEHLEPIPLTEEWLVRLGMLKYTDSIPYAYVFNLDKKLGFNRFRLQWARYGDGVEGFYNLHLYKIQCARVQYVHELQNLYFALTGKELEVKP